MQRYQTPPSPPTFSTAFVSLVPQTRLRLLLCASCDQEQTSIAKLGLELRLLSSDLDAEVEKWEEQEHELVRQSQSLASMAYNMHLFTR